MWKAFAFRVNLYTDDTDIVHLGTAAGAFDAAAICMKSMSADTDRAYYVHLFADPDVAMLFRFSGTTRLDHDSRYVVDPVSDGIFGGFIVARDDVAAFRFLNDKDAQIRPSAVALDDDWNASVMAGDITSAIILSLIAQNGTGSEAISRYTTQAGTFYATSAAPSHELTEAFV